MRYIAAFVLSFALLGCTILLSACTLGSPEIQDIKVRSARSVNESAITDDRWLGPEPVASKWVLMVEFTTRVDLYSFAREYDLTVGNDASVCSSHGYDPTNSIVGDPAVYGDLGKVTPFVPANKETKRRSAASARHYHIYLEPRADSNIPSFPEHVAYNFRVRAEAICFYLHGGDMIGDSYKSNVAVVPKQIVFDALHSSVH